MDLTVPLTAVLPFGEDDFRFSNLRYSHLSAASYQFCDHEQDLCLSVFICKAAIIVVPT